MSISSIPEADPKAMREFGQLVQRLRADAMLTKPPRWRHESVIQLHRLGAYYAVWNAELAFRQCLCWLFENWTWTNAERFVRWFRLPQYSIEDLAQGRDSRKRSKIDEPALHVGSRTYPGLEPLVTEEEARRRGYRPDPPRLKDLDSLHQGALRLYRRAVLGCSWQKIAEEEIDVYEQHPDANTVKGQIKDWARGLRVTLPDRPAGRPRGS